MIDVHRSSDDLPRSGEDFLGRLKASLVGERRTPFVVVGNFEVEQYWAEGEYGLPRAGFSTAGAVVNRMDEFALLLAGPDDHVVLKEAPDPDFLGYLSALGVPLPGLLCPERQDPERVVTADVLDDEPVLARLRALAATGAQLLPHGVSVLEERLARAGDLPVAGGPATLCKRVNSKIYSRRLADELGLPQPAGWTSETLAEWAAAAGRARQILAAGGTVAVKDAFGVSGRGILVLRDGARLDQLDRMLRRRAERSGDDRLALVVEEWVGKRTDLNYQVTVGRTGTVHFDFVKEAITEGGVHQGHRFPARLSPAEQGQLRDAGELIGRRLAGEGYRGVVGIDAMVGDDGRILPVIEINARHNMSTYQARVQELLLAPGQRAMARHYPVRLRTRVPFKTFHDRLDDLLLPGAGGTGVLVTTFATVNAAAGRPGAETFDGRLYTLLVADSADRLGALDAEVGRRLRTLTEVTG
ncbi:ATP-grasp domain-containing protein [Plantactinospora sp. BC1]|uniref:preATP grasp domain-containing protein n=1 Tax=Plantactinospora sp. BC1 TaxID=2108470 RepID=UPI001F3B1CFD|nr:ATP-grasp domain-containing protein [Plantactinospora sp. BC1]